MAGVLHCRARVVSYLPGLHVLVSRVGAAGGVLSGNKPVVSDQSSILSSDLGGQLESTVPSGPQEPNVLLLLRGGDGGCGRHQDASRRLPLATPAPGGEEEESVICHYFEGLLKADPSPSDSVPKAEGYFEKSKVECITQPCPEQLKMDFCSMFPEATPSDLMLITVTQKTVNDMVYWSFAVEEEREQLLERFIDGAKKICSALQSEGFWADFIDPSSGLPFFGLYTNNTLFETDDRYRHLGFQTEDLGCCRVIRHQLWGTNVFVGTIFTCAPPDSSVMKKLQCC